MTHRNVIEFLSGSVWAATDDTVEAVVRVTESILNGSNSVLADQFRAEQGEESGPATGVEVRGGIATVPLSGTITPRATMMSNFSGGTSAEEFAATINALTERSDIHTILLDVDSNGGSVHGVSAAAAAVRKARESKRVWAIARYNMNSAAYWIASAADRVFVTPTSNIGSIGVLAQLRFASEDEQQRVQIIRSVPGKAAVNPFEPLSDESRTKLQNEIDRIHVSFTEAVSLNRRISMDKAQELANGEVEMGAAAVEAGLADEVVETAADVIAQIETEENVQLRLTSMKEAYLAAEVRLNDTLNAMADLKSELQSAQETVADLQGHIDAVAVEAKNAKIEAVVDAAIDSGRIAAGLKPEFISDLASGSVSLEAFERMVSNISPGTVVPQGEIDSTHQADAADPLAPSNELEARLFDQFPSLRNRTTN